MEEPVEEPNKDEVDKAEQDIKSQLNMHFEIMLRDVSELRDSEFTGVAFAIFRRGYLRGMVDALEQC